MKTYSWLLNSVTDNFHFRFGREDSRPPSCSWLPCPVCTACWTGTAWWHAGGAWKSVFEDHTTPHHTTPHHSLFPVWTAASAACVNVKRTFWGQMGSRRRYDPAAICLLSSSAPSLLTARLRERREGSHLRASPVCCCCRNQDILPAPHRNSRDFFFSLGGCASSSSSSSSWK